MRMRNEGERLCIPGIEPEILPGQKNASFVADFNHRGIYAMPAGTEANLSGCGLTPSGAIGLIGLMRTFAVLLAICLAGASEAASTVDRAGETPRTIDPNFQFRKFKVYTLTDETPVGQGLGKKKGTSDLATRRSFRSKAGVQEASINFERAYRLHGAVTGYDQRERHGQYFDFFWRSQRPADVTLRFEYKQEKLRASVQSKEIKYQNIHGTVHTPFQVIGDEFNDDGAVLAWRCLILERGRIVAEKRSFLWE